MGLPAELQHIIGELVSRGKNPGLAEIDIVKQFKRNSEGREGVAEKLNAAFLFRYAGEKHPLYREAVEYIDTLRSHPEYEEIILFLESGIEVIGREIEEGIDKNPPFRKRYEELHEWLKSGHAGKNSQETAGKIRGLFFPEGGGETDDAQEKIISLRSMRKVSLTELNPESIDKPGEEILFTSNALITLPSSAAEISECNVNPLIIDDLETARNEDQVYWYDHPVQIGVAPENNELIYGLEHFDASLEYEEENGLKEKGTNVDFLLSVSVTHKGLHKISREYIEYELKKNSRIKRLNIHVFTEKDTREMVDRFLIPAAETFLDIDDAAILHEIIGVDGEYGRHYSFLKAIAPLWQLLVSHKTRGTFKIDLDQVFPQKELLEITGSTAFGHLRSRLWGAEGKDARGRPVHLGLIAGALVNQKDIGKSLYAPDVPLPEKDPTEDTLVFFSRLPQAISTVAEMQTRYREKQEIDGVHTCIQRIHVTGGTNGILVESLKRYRPFTPSFLGRAEDQAYILSVLLDEKNGSFLRYVHRDGLVMRHDKEGFATDSIEAAKTGKMIGDYVRIVLFSYYADSLPWDIEKIKEEVDPFTGCFISSIPWTVVILRLMLKTAALFKKEQIEEGFRLLSMGSRRLGKLLEELQPGKNNLTSQFTREKRGWDMYYDILDILRERLKQKDVFAVELRERARKIIAGCRIDI